MASESELIARIVSGDSAAADEFVERFGGLVYTILTRDLRLPSDRADEVFQQLFVRLWEGQYRRLRQWRGRGKFTSYLAVLVRRLAYDDLRSRPPRTGTASGDSHDEPPATQRDAMEQMLVHEQGQAVREAVAQLLPRDREILERRHEQGQSYREMAEAMGMTVSHVGVALARAEARLTKILRAKFPGVFDETWDAEHDEA